MRPVSVYVGGCQGREVALARGSARGRVGDGKEHW